MQTKDGQDKVAQVPSLPPHQGLDSSLLVVSRCMNRAQYECND